MLVLLSVSFFLFNLGFSGFPETSKNDHYPIYTKTQTGEAGNFSLCGNNPATFAF